MGRVGRIFVFFAALSLMVFLFVGVSVVAQRDRISFNELFSFIHPVFSQNVESLSSDLVSEGVNLEQQYTLGQVKFICSSMSSEYGGDWTEVSNQVQTAGSIEELTGGISSAFGKPKCTYRVVKRGWDSAGPTVCSQTCSTKNLCYDCCDRGKADPGEGWDEDDYNRCYKACDKISPVAIGGNSQSSDAGN